MSDPEPINVDQLIADVESARKAHEAMWEHCKNLLTRSSDRRRRAEQRLAHAVKFERKSKARRPA